MKKNTGKKQKDLRLCWPLIWLLAFKPFINKYVYFAKSQFLLISEMLIIKLSLKFGKTIQNYLRNSAVSFINHNENYNASGKLVNENLLSQLF